MRAHNHTTTGRLAREARQAQAEANREMAALDQSEQLKRLDKRLGRGVGATRERLRLIRIIGDNEGAAGLNEAQKVAS